MTEEQIERRVEHLFNRLDARLMDGQMTQAEYDAEAKRIHEWAEERYRRIAVSLPLRKPEND